MTEFKNLISVAQLQEHVADRDLCIVDCRFDLMQDDKGREDYLAGHIPGSVYADLDRDLADPVSAQSGRHPLPDVARFAECLGRLGIGNDTQVVAYDGSNGSLAAHLWWLLRWVGHDRVAVLDGGLAAWHAAGGDVERGEGKIACATFKAKPDPSRVATTAEIYASLNSTAAANLVDARDPARFLGQSEPIDTVAGHIPGAINLPLTRNLNAEGLWRSAGELAELWEKTLAKRTDAKVTVMCGSGVTACHLVLSAQIAGIEEPRLYVGSWSEWIRDARRPVATGNNE